MSPEPIAARRVLVDGVSTLYYEHGAGTPVLLVPGVASSARDWFPVMRELGDTCRVLAPALPGLGGTGPLPGVEPPRVASFLAGFLKALGVDGVTAVGHSYGGLLVAELALSHPELVDRLVLVDASGLGRAAHPAALALGVLPARAADLVSWLTAVPGFEAAMALSSLLLLRQPWRVPPQTWLAQARLSGSRQAVRTSLEVFREGANLTGQRPGILVVDRLADIRVPTLVVWGATDCLFPLWQARSAVRELPNGRLVVLMGAGHVAHLDRHTDFMDAVGPFVRDRLDRVP
ncbi:alpha/beta hydrolase [Streptomyces ziwulingensis]|uniref:Alpha/beta fold hydrolase n=1 Tax=Streptomyces ziwulingensis TaxID=1045501 RepID=A0ABP9CN90_9ACTN